MYFRCYCIDQRHVRIMPYEPRHPYHLRYQTEWQAPPEILRKVEQGVLTLNQFLGYDLNTVEFAMRDGIPVAIDFCNPAPDAEAASVGQANFEWVVEAQSADALFGSKQSKLGQIRPRRGQSPPTLRGVRLTQRKFDGRLGEPSLI
jgi:hypothetical protein